MLMQGKNVLVTGGAAGIGESIVRLFCQEGARVWILDSDSDRLEALGDVLRSESFPISTCVADLSRPAQIQEAFDGIHKQVEALDVLVNNAGIFPRQGFTEMTEEQWNHVLDVNLNGAFRCTRLAIAPMAKRGSGKIIFISSVTFHWGLEKLTHYVASKGGLIGFARSLAREFGSFNIHVNCITPGAIATEKEAKFATEDQVREILKLQSLQRRIVPVDIARACLFLASEWSDGITGQTINVDGGWVMH